VLRVIRSKQGGTATANGPSTPNGSAAAGARRRNAPSAGAAASPPPPPHTPEQAALISRVLSAGSDYYSILEVSSSASEIEVKKAYRRAALRLHPDKCSAPRSAEAFGALSRAFACLSDASKRTHYDRWGRDPDDAAARMGGGGGGTRRGGGMAGGNPFGGGGGDFFDAEDIFNAFFGVGRRGGAGMGGPFGSAGPFGGPFGAGPFGGFAGGGGGMGGGGAPPRRPRQRQHQRQGGGGAAAAEEPPTPPWLALLAQLAPLVLLLFFTLMPSSSDGGGGGGGGGGASSYYSYADSGPPASLERSPPFTERVSTASRGVPFFVRPPAEAFARAFPPGTRERSRVDGAVEAAFKERLQRDCYAERVSAARLERDHADQARGREKERRKREKAEAKRRKRAGGGGGGGGWFGGGGGGGSGVAPPPQSTEEGAEAGEREEPRWEPPQMPSCEDLATRFGVGNRQQQQQQAGGWGG